MIRRTATVALSAASLAIFGVAAAAPASAGTSHAYYIYSPSGGGYGAYGAFNDNGEIFTVCDILGDGYGVNLYWNVSENPSNNGVVRDGNGANGDCSTQDANITDSHHVNWQVCFTNGGSIVSCSALFQDIA